LKDKPHNEITVITKLNSSQKLAMRSCAGCYLLVLAGLLALETPLRADSYAETLALFAE
jgi:hypothetical protein